MIRILFISVLIFFFGRASAQQDSLIHPERAFDYEITSFAVNNLGELYLINSSNQLKKIDSKGDSTGVFNQVTKYGKLSYVEAQNPWRTILFYENFSTIVLLDKFLDVVTSVNLKKNGIFRTKAVTSSYDNNIWVYDELDNKLKKIDDGGNLLLETVDLRTVLDTVPSPIQVIDSDGFIYLYDPEKGLYTFDNYGTYKNRLAFLGWKHVAVGGKFVYGFDDKYFYTYELKTLNLKRFVLPPVFKEYSSVKVGGGKIYLLKEGKLTVYKVGKS